MASKALLLSILVMLFMGCSIFDPSIKVSDVRKEEKLLLKSTQGKLVHAITIRGEGQISGEATITLMLNGKPYKTEKLNGAVNFTWSGDWYSDTAEIYYVPTRVESGELKLSYRFASL